MQTLFGGTPAGREAGRGKKIPGGGRVFEFVLDDYVSKSCVYPHESDQGYFYITIPDGPHGRYKRIWVNRGAIVEKDGKYTISDWLTWRKTSKGNIVLLPNDKMISTVVILFGQGGYRGGSTLTGSFGTIYKGSYYRSPRGALGTYDVVLAEVRDGDTIHMDRTGRLYGGSAHIDYRVIFSGEGIEILRADETADEELKQLL